MGTAVTLPRSKRGVNLPEVVGNGTLLCQNGTSESESSCGKKWLFNGRTRPRRDSCFRCRFRAVKELRDKRLRRTIYTGHRSVGWDGRSILLPSAAKIAARRVRSGVWDMLTRCRGGEAPSGRVLGRNRGLGWGKGRCFVRRWSLSWGQERGRERRPDGAETCVETADAGSWSSRRRVLTGVSEDPLPIVRLPERFGFRAGIHREFREQKCLQGPPTDHPSSLPSVRRSLACGEASLSHSPLARRCRPRFVSHSPSRPSAASGSPDRPTFQWMSSRYCRVRKLGAEIILYEGLETEMELY